MDQKQQNRDQQQQNKDAKSAEPVQLDKEQQGKQGEQTQGGKPHQGAENR
jgi:hypothetical protein